MKFFILTIALVALTRSERAPEKRGVATSQQTYTASPPASISYAKLQQPLQKAQPQYYTQQVAAPAAYSIPYQQQQYQYQPQPQQAVAYAQPAPQAIPSSLSKVTAYRQPFSPANDVSSFAYSSPLVSYNNLGLLSQVVGRIGNPSPVQTKVAAAPAPAAYQQSLQKVAYAQPSQISYDTASQAQLAKYSFAAQPAAAPQQYFSQAPQQGFAAAPPVQTYQAAQQYSAQAVPQALYSQSTQYYNPGQQVQQGKQAANYAQ